MRELTPEEKQRLQEKIVEQRTEALSKMKELPAEVREQLGETHYEKSFSSQEAVGYFIIEQLNRSMSRQQITQALVEKGHPEESSALLVEALFVKVKQDKAVQHLTYAGILFFISIGVPVLSQLITANAFYYITPFTFLTSVGYFISGLTLKLRFRPSKKAKGQI